MKLLSSIISKFFLLMYSLIFTYCCSAKDVTNKELIASFTYSPTIASQAVQFTDTSTGSPTSWLWNFGNGTMSSTRNPSHTYLQAGSYLVTLTVWAGAKSASTSETINISYSHVITAASPSFTDVNAAIAAAQPGDTIVVPAGTATWSDHLVITKGIILIGAGKANTIITSNYNAPDLHVNPPMGNSLVEVCANFLISYIPSAPTDNDPFRISGFTFDLAEKCEGILLCNYVSSPWITRIRIDSNAIKFPKLGAPPQPSYEIGNGYSICIWGQICGVADSNDIIIGMFGVYGMNTNWSNDTFQFGSPQNFYFEDNNIVLANSANALYGVHSGIGGRWCYRYNSIDATGAELGLWPLMDAHGNMGIGGNYGIMGFEAYENNIELHTQNARLIDQRGGRGIFFNNNINTNGSVGIGIREEYLDSLNPPAIARDGETQYICDSYYWNNTQNNSALLPVTILGTLNYGDGTGQVPRENRDFWFQGPSFNGTTGVGVGPLASRPATCTPGVGYWASDERRLYRATATNTWTAYYTPYVYPHPLRMIAW